MNNALSMLPSAKNIRGIRGIPLLVIAASLVLAAALLMLVKPASAAGVVPDAPTPSTLNDPPAAGHQIIAFPERDFVSANGYKADTTYTVNVLRTDASGTDVTVGSSTVTSDANGLVEVNHPGGGCWVGFTPDIKPGDKVRLTDPKGVADQTTVANVKVSPKPGSTTTAVIQKNASTIELHGTAQDSAGAPLPLDKIEQRLISRKDPFAKNGRRDLRTGKDGTLAYDAPGSPNWTATYTGLSAADITKALNAQARVLWLGRNPAAGTEQTIFEFGEVGGPAAPCTAPPAV